MKTITNIKDILTRWITDYLKNKDILDKKIQKIEKGGKTKSEPQILIQYPEKKLSIYVQPFLKSFEPILKKEKKESHIAVVVLNVHENLKVLLDEWKKVIGYPNLTVYFVNPDSENENRWVIYPYTHNMWCDVKSLKAGLISLFQTVEEYGS
ncbi:hypothetical protein GF351_04535 [Candidatus Woesearchaeota archaeon]|nr:hypothetical protein [Candidatus Woesearchaeota archaeon]